MRRPGQKPDDTTGPIPTSRSQGAKNPSWKTEASISSRSKPSATPAQAGIDGSLSVSHGDAIRAAIAHLAGVSPQDAPWVDVPNGAVARVTRHEVTWLGQSVD